MQVVNVHLCRSRRASLLTISVLGNRLIAAGILAELGVMLVIAYTAIGNRLFGTAPIPLWVWLGVIPLGLAMLGLEEIRKALLRGRFRGPGKFLHAEVSLRRH